MHTQLILYCSLKGWSLKLYSPYCQVSWAKKVFLNSRLLLHGRNSSGLGCYSTNSAHTAAMLLGACFSSNFCLSESLYTFIVQPTSYTYCNLFHVSCSDDGKHWVIIRTHTHTHADFELFTQVIERNIILALGLSVLVQGLYLLSLNPTLLYNWKGAFCLWFCRYRRSTGPSVIWDLCPRPVGRGNRSKITEGPILGPFPTKNRAGMFSLLRNSDWLAGTFRGQKIPVQPDWYLPLVRRSQYSLTGAFCWSEDPSTAWLVPSAGHKIPVQSDWYLPRQKIPVQPDWYLLLVRRSQYSLTGTFHRRRSRLLKTGFFRGGKGAENIKGKIQAALRRGQGDEQQGSCGRCSPASASSCSKRVRNVGTDV
jgi:hypothetical protein